MTSLNLLEDPIQLTQDLVDIPSPSHEETAIADAIEAALREQVEGVEIHRFKNNVIARTNYGHPTRVILAGHIDTVPIADNVPSTRADGLIWGCGSVDMKSGDAVFLHLFASMVKEGTLGRDVTLICYEGEEVASKYNGLGQIAAEHPEWLEGDLAILGEPSGAVIEAGCQGTIRLKVMGHGTRAHSARSWLGSNAMHALAPVISNIANYEAKKVLIDGCEYREGLNIVRMECGVANNTIPDEAWFFVNYRFAPDKTVDEAMAHMLEVMDLPENVTYEVDDAVPGALPGLAEPAAAELVKASGGEFRAKFGWTDVARFAELGLPAVNFGPGDPSFCHKKDEQCAEWMITQVSDILRQYLLN
ncbi:MAG: succinyl-diaminopimelate desuccinylase [Corynebacterium sp.]|nr:succinyl-diaminopimelate desuccinylase [Corynebacterium sp.]